MNSDRFEITPTLNYSLNKDIALTTTLTFGSEADINWAFGLLYKFSKDKQVTIMYNENMSNLTHLDKATIIV